jgi:DNA polymerase I-like protein with 3'-5' exonuclease and polymerase domains
MGHYPEIIRNDIGNFAMKYGRVVSVDFEFPPETMEPSIIGLSAGAGAHSAYYDKIGRDTLRTLEYNKVTWVGHNSLTVEREIIASETGSVVPLERMEDTMLLHYLCNAELCKGAVKGGMDDEDEDVKERGMGFMDLWSMSSLYTDLPQWKQCRGEHCDGGCRFHDVLGYNGIDALSCDLALPNLLDDMRRKQIPDALYQNLKKLTVLTHKMTEQGIKMDRELVRKLESEFEARKGSIFPSKWVPKIGKKGQELKTKELVWEAPFNPRSPKQVLEWFSANGVGLDSTDKEEIQHALANLNDKSPEDVRLWLGKLYEFKDAGKGLKPWTDERYFHVDGLMHPRFPPYGSSLGRLSSSWPNFMNIPRVGWGKGVRAGVIPRDPSLMLVKADKSQLELRMCLWYAGYPLPKDDAFTWLVENSGGVFYKIAEDNPDKGWTPRDWTKSVSHGGDYGEGVKVLYGRDLDKSSTKRAIEAGALVVYRDWEYHGGVVGFTGTNLATRLFGSATWENRRRALQIQEAYFGRFGAIREWQKRVSAQAETGHVQTASGRYLTLLGSPEDKFKIALAMYGQGGGADDVQDAMRRYDDLGYIPLLQVHDELVFELPKTTPDQRVLDFFRPFSMPSTSLVNNPLALGPFMCPVSVSRGPNWLDQTKVGKV